MVDGNQETQSATQFSIFLINKPGILARVCQKLAEDQVNIVAMSMMDSIEHGVLRLVAADPDAARASLQPLHLTMAETEVLLATLPNRPGALADVVARLAAGRVSVNYAYVTSGAVNGKTTGVFRVSDHQKAMRVLAEQRKADKQGGKAGREKPATKKAKRA
jgi:hypothetical protein